MAGEFDGEGANGKRLLTLTGETAGEGCGTTVARLPATSIATATQT